MKGVRKCCISNAVNWTDDDIYGMVVKRMGMLGVNVRKMKAQIMEMETVILNGEGK